MIRHTTLNLDMDLVEEARRVLKTKQVTDTVHRALQEVVSAQKRASLARRRLSLTPTSLRSMRRARTRRLSRRLPAARWHQCMGAASRKSLTSLSQATSRALSEDRLHRVVIPRASASRLFRVMATSNRSTFGSGSAPDHT